MKNYNNETIDTNFLYQLTDGEYIDLLNREGDFEFSDCCEIGDFYENGVIKTEPMENLKKAVEEVYQLDLYDIWIVTDSNGVVWVTWSI